MPETAASVEAWHGIPEFAGTRSGVALREMLIRSPTESDADAVSSLLGELGYPVAVDLVWPRLSPLLIREDYRILVTEDDCVTLGLAAAHVVPVIHSAKPVAMITALVVTASARGRGLGKALIRSLEDFAHDRGCGKILATTAAGRSEAHAFYERLGYGFTGRRYVKEVTSIGIDPS